MGTWLGFQIMRADFYFSIHSSTKFEPKQVFLKLPFSEVLLGHLCMEEQPLEVQLPVGLS